MSLYLFFQSIKTRAGIIKFLPLVVSLGWSKTLYSLHVIKVTAVIIIHSNIYSVLLHLTKGRPQTENGAC